MVDINEAMADLMNFERKDIIKQIPCPDDIENCPTYHCERVGFFYQNHDYRIDGDDWNPKGDMNQAMSCGWKSGLEIYIGIEDYQEQYDDLIRGIVKAFKAERLLFREYYEKVEDAPLAICKVILKSKGIEV